jgi:hypothetical protein
MMALDDPFLLFRSRTRLLIARSLAGAGFSAHWRATGAIPREDAITAG